MKENNIRKSTKKHNGFIPYASFLKVAKKAGVYEYAKLEDCVPYFSDEHGWMFNTILYTPDKNRTLLEAMKMVYSKPLRIYWSRGK